MSDQDLYFGDVLAHFANGVQLDLRVKLAVEFLKSPCFFEPAHPVDRAVAALDMAQSLIAEAGARGWLKPLPDDSELTTPMRRHLERNVRAQVFSQFAGQRIQAEEAPSIAVGANGPLPNAGRRQ
jgi:hypothetical protein